MLQNFSIFFINTKPFNYIRHFSLHHLNFFCSEKKKINLNQQNNTKLFFYRKDLKYNKYIILIFVYFLCISSIFFFFFCQNFTEKKIININFAKAHVFSEQPALSKLKTIPVFSITNRTGAPFLIQNKKGEQIGLLFLSYREAIEFSREMLKSHQAKKTYLYVINLEKAFKMVNQGIISSGIKDSYGLKGKMKFQFVQDKKQMSYTRKISKKNKILGKIPFIPIFTIDGLVINKGKEQIFPMFFDKDDLVIIWKKIQKKDPSLEKKPQIIEGDFIQLILFMRLDYKNEGNLRKLFNFGFVPSSKNLNFIRTEKTNKPFSIELFDFFFKQVYY